MKKTKMGSPSNPQSKIEGSRESGVSLQDNPPELAATKTMNAEQFLSDVAKHELIIRSDIGLYRHLLFRSPSNSWNMWFELITWPGSLTIHGDMGTWAFSRVDDMFTFFRSDQLRINKSYWGEKITSESRYGGPSKKFNADTFKENVLSCLDGYEIIEPQKAAIIAALDEEVFVEEDESSARRALSHFKHDGFAFSESWEINGEGYAYHYLWCLYAIVWGIQQYDLAEPGRAPAGPLEPKSSQD